MEVLKETKLRANGEKICKMLIVRGSAVCVLLFLVLCIVCTKVYGKSSFVSEINSFNFWLIISKSYNLSILLNNVAAMSLFLFHFQIFPEPQSDRIKIRENANFSTLLFLFSFRP